MNTKLKEMNQKSEKNEMRVKKTMETAMHYVMTLWDWEKKVDEMDVNDKEKEMELEEELESLIKIEDTMELLDQRIMEENKLIQDYFKEIPDPEYGDYDLQDAYLTLEAKEDKGTLVDSEHNVYTPFDAGTYKLHPYQRYHNRRHNMVRMIMYLFSKGVQEMEVNFCYYRNLDQEKNFEEMIYPDITEKEWERICNLMVDCDIFTVSSQMSYKDEWFSIMIDSTGKLVVQSEKDIAYNFNEVLENMEEVHYENIRNLA